MTSVLRVNYMTEFKGDDVVLVTMDRPGIYVLQSALLDATERGTSRLEHDGVVHEFRIEAGAADVELQPNSVVWRLDQTRVTEIIEDLEVLGEGEHGAGHQYVDDMLSPAGVLMLSRDEYVDVVYPWQQPPRDNHE